MSEILGWYNCPDIIIKRLIKELNSKKEYLK